MGSIRGGVASAQDEVGLARVEVCSAQGKVGPGQVGVGAAQGELPSAQFAVGSALGEVGSAQDGLGSAQGEATVEFGLWWVQFRLRWAPLRRSSPALAVELAGSPRCSQTIDFA